MDYNLKLSLEHIVLVKIAAVLWNQPDIRTLLTKYNFPLHVIQRKKEWGRIEDKVTAKVWELPQPEFLKYQILYYIKPVGLQILKWMTYHKNYGLYLPDEFHWTPQGTVHKKKMAEVLVKDESLSVITRYKLSCIYCLKDDSLELWNKMAENDKQSFYNEEDPISVNEKEFIVLWTYYIKGEISKMNSRIAKIFNRRRSPFLFGMEQSLKHGNEVAMEYFMQKMSSRKKQRVIVKNAKLIAMNLNMYVSISLMENEMDILCFLLSHMTKEQQIDMIELYPYEVLYCLLNWPWQGLFMEAAKRSWIFLFEEDYFNLLKKIMHKVIDGYKDWDYKKLFRDFWHQSHDSHKKFILEKCSRFYDILIDLFITEDEDNIRLMFKYASVLEKKNFIFSEWGSYICHDLIDWDEWHLLELFLKECTSSKDDLIAFKDRFVDCGQIHLKESFESIRHKIDQFFSLVDNIVSMCNKRRCEDECDNVPAKKVHRV